MCRQLWIEIDELCIASILSSFIEHITKRKAECCYDLATSAATYFWKSSEGPDCWQHELLSHWLRLLPAPLSHQHQGSPLVFHRNQTLTNESWKLMFHTICIFNAGNALIIQFARVGYNHDSNRNYPGYQKMQIRAGLVWSKTCWTKNCL